MLAGVHQVVVDGECEPVPMVVALLDDQELDSRGSTGAIYWEGLSDLRDERGQRIGRGYLEMTGYAAAIKLG